MAPHKQPKASLSVVAIFTTLLTGVSCISTAEDKMKLVSQGVDAFLQGNVQGFLDMFSEDHVYDCAGGPETPWSGVWKGQDGFLKAIEVYNQYVNFTVNDFDLFASPSTGRVVAQYDLKGIATKTGKPIEQPCFLRFDINDDLKITETIEACNSLKELRVLIEGGSQKEGSGDKKKVDRELK